MISRDQILKLVEEYVREAQQTIQTSVPVSGSKLTPEDVASIVDTALSGWVTEGTKTKEFMNKLRKYVGTKYAVFCNSGSSANLLAITAALDLFCDYDRFKVVTSALAFPTTVAPIVQSGLVPYFVDCDPRTLNPSTEDIISALQDVDVAGVILAHTLGFPFDADIIKAECEKLGKWFIEDCADALGAMVGGQAVGSFGDMATYSFFPAHHCTTAEGGAVLTNNVELHKLLNTYRSWGRSCVCAPGQDNVCGKRFDHKFERMPEGYDHKYTFTKFGYNLKGSDLHASIGTSQMNRIDWIVGVRRWNFHSLRDALLKYSNILLFVEWDTTRIQPSPFGFPISVSPDAKFTRNQLVAHLEASGIRTRPVFGGNITRQPMFDDGAYHTYYRLDGADFVMNNTFWVGCHPELTKTQLDKIVSEIEIFMRKYYG